MFYINFGAMFKLWLRHYSPPLNLNYNYNYGMWGLLHIIKQVLLNNVLSIIVVVCYSLITFTFLPLITYLVTLSLLQPVFKYGITKLTILIFSYLYRVLDKLSLYQNFDKMPSPFRLFILFLLTYVLALRSFFKDQEHPIFFHFLSILIIINTIFQYYFGFILFTMVQFVFFLLFVGMHCITVDAHGSAVSEVCQTRPLTSFSLSIKTHLISMQKSQRFFARYFGFRAAAGLFMGKSTLTATGQAALFTAGITGSLLALNEHLRRRHEARQGELSRSHDAQQAELDRNHTAQQGELDRSHSAQQGDVNRDLEERKLAFEKQKHSDAQMANARKSWWSSSK